MALLARGQNELLDSLQEVGTADLFRRAVRILNLRNPRWDGYLSMVVKGKEYVFNAFRYRCTHPTITCAN